MFLLYLCCTSSFLFLRMPMKQVFKDVCFPKPLLFQCSTIFTFYHEFAHCVQKQSSSLNERPENRSYSFYIHVCEYDADLNGAQFVSMYMQQYYTDMLPADMRNEKNFKRLMYLGISSIVITFLLFLKYPSEYIWSTMYLLTPTTTSTLLEAFL